jgi:hypothetical protein
MVGLTEIWKGVLDHGVGDVVPFPQLSKSLPGVSTFACPSLLFAMRHPVGSSYPVTYSLGCVSSPFWFLDRNSMGVLLHKT